MRRAGADGVEDSLGNAFTIPQPVFNALEKSRDLSHSSLENAAGVSHTPHLRREYEF